MMVLIITLSVIGWLALSHDTSRLMIIAGDPNTLAESFDDEKKNCHDVSSRPWCGGNDEEGILPASEGFGRPESPFLRGVP